MTCTVNGNTLAHFIGTQSYFKHWCTKYKFTEGVHYLWENGCAWLIDEILLWGQAESKVLEFKAECKRQQDSEFQVWTLRKIGDSQTAATLFCTDGDYATLAEKPIPFTDFTLSEVKLFLIDGILLLASEY